MKRVAALLGLVAVVLAMLPWLVLSPATEPPEPYGAAAVRPHGAGFQRTEPSGDLDGTAPASRFDEASEREAAPTDRWHVQGRVVDAATGDGLPFATVEVRGDGVEERVVADRAGRFRTSGVFGAQGQVRALHEPDEERLPMPALIARIRSAPVGTWQRVSSADPVEVPLTTGPTYFVRTTLPDAVALSAMRANVASGASLDVPEPSTANDPGVPLREVPGEPGLFWCRFPSLAQVAGPASLTLRCADLGTWHGRAGVRQVRGVQLDPVVVSLLAPAGLRGVVLGGDGRPRRNVFVTVSHDTGPWTRRSDSRTEDDGSYSLVGEMPGSVLIEVVGEDVEPWRRRIVLQPGVDHVQDIYLAQRRLGGAVAGSVTTKSGRAFPSCKIVLSSRDDASVWRAANIHWRDVGGRSEGMWSFENVPVVACDVTLHALLPCEASACRLPVTAPAAGLRFHVDDCVTLQPVVFHVVDRAGRDVRGWSLFLSGGAGTASAGEVAWQTRLHRALPGPVSVDVPADRPFTWNIAGDDVRLASGAAVARAGARAEVRVVVESGFSAVLRCTEGLNTYPARGVAVFADGRHVGATAVDGTLALDLHTRPLRLGVDAGAFRIRRIPGEPADVGPTGVLSLQRDGATVALSVDRVH